MNFVIVSSGGIDCFKCTSINGSNPACEDPFHNNYTTDILERPCMGGRKGRNGLFPASSCVKVAGKYGKKHSPYASNNEENTFDTYVIYIHIDI